MKVYQLTVNVIDFEGIGPEGAKDEIENMRHLIAKVGDIKEKDIGLWTDDHPLNNSNTAPEEWKKLFG